MTVLLKAAQLPRALDVRSTWLNRLTFPTDRSALYNHWFAKRSLTYIPVYPELM